MNAAPAPHPIAVAESELADLRDRLRRTRWPDRETVDDWSQGIPLAYVRDVCRYWADDYDWRRVEAELNAHDQLRCTEPERARHPRAARPVARAVARCRWY